MDIQLPLVSFNALKYWKSEISVKLNEYSKSEKSISKISRLLVESFAEKNEIFTPTFIILQVFSRNFEKSLLSGCLHR